MGKFIDLSGKRFGYWEVIERDFDISKKNIYWKCRCKCGTVRSVAGTSLRSGISISCGCEKDKKTSIRTKLSVEDMTGLRFGHWTVIKRDLSSNNDSKRGARWICRCDCGNEKSVLGYALRFGRSTSCGCQNNINKIIDIAGKRFGKLLVLEIDNENKNQKGAYWICKCECGNKISVSGSRLRSGQTKSCGCLKFEHSNHDMTILTGQIFGNWTVIKKDESIKKREAFYICRCKCGNEKSVSSFSLKNGRSKSCGCKKKKPLIDLTGQKFGKLTVLGLSNDVKKGGNWECICDCGKIKTVSTNNLKRGNVVSCGCVSRQLSSERRFKNIKNCRFGRLVAIEVHHREVDNQGNSSYFWKCLCDCGNSIIVQSSVLRRGDTKSCGCLQSEESAKRAKERTMDLKGIKFGLLTVVERVKVDDNSRYETWRCVCDCGKEKLADGYQLKKGLIASCGCLKQSKYETFVLKYFDEKGYESPTDFEYQIRFNDLRGYGDGQLSYDFAVYKKNNLYALIECQGQQHYKPVDLFGGEEQFAKQQLHDEIKREYANRINTMLIEIPYTVVKYEEVKDILMKADI